MTKQVERIQPLVPNELEGYLKREHVVETLERWQGVTQSDIVEQQERARTTLTLPDDRRVRVGWFPAEGDSPTDETLVVLLEHQQKLKLAKVALVLMMRDLAMPGASMAVLANNGMFNSPRLGGAYQHTPEEIAALRSGNARSHTELQLRILEHKQLGINGGKVVLSGYSKGGGDAIRVAAAAEKFAVTVVDANEAPSKQGRDARRLQKDFLGSSGFGMQMAAIRGSAVPVIGEIYSPRRLAVDYVRFGLATLNRQNNALHHSMAGSVRPEVELAVANHKDAVVKIGYIAGSTVFDPESVAGVAGVHLREYTGEHVHGHTTGNNIVAAGLMLIDALSQRNLAH